MLFLRFHRQAHRVFSIGDGVGGDTHQLPLVTAGVVERIDVASFARHSVQIEFAILPLAQAISSPFTYFVDCGSAVNLGYPRWPCALPSTEPQAGKPPARGATP